MEETDVPDELKEWLIEREVGGNIVEVKSTWPLFGSKKREYVLAAPRLSKIIDTFKNNDYNPRKPDPNRVKQLRASISQLSLLSPLTCAMLPESEDQDEKERVILLDGRHRFEALKQLKEFNSDWSEDPPIDLKILYNLEKSELLILATYMNRTRRNLRKGEYYKKIVDIFEDRKDELAGRDGKPPKESEVFKSIDPNSLQNIDFDLSIGRIVGLVGFDDEEQGRWVPKIGTYQGDKYRSEDDGFNYYCPMTAGNLAVFLRHICKTGPYDDYGDSRMIEIQNVTLLGKLFSTYVLNDKILKRDETKKSTTASKYWVLDAFGKILEEYGAKFSAKKDPLMSDPDLDWKSLEKTVRVFAEVMEEQAAKIKAYKDGGKYEDLRKSWTYQTQQKQVKDPLLNEFKERLPEIFG